jgi:hypothetical protein
VRRGPRSSFRRITCTSVNVSTETIAGCAGTRDRTTCLAETSPGSLSSSYSVHRPNTAEPVYRGFSGIARTVLPCQPSANRCRSWSGRRTDGHGTPSRSRPAANAQVPDGRAARPGGAALGPRAGRRRHRRGGRRRPLRGGGPAGRGRGATPRRRSGAARPRADDRRQPTRTWPSAGRSARDRRRPADTNVRCSQRSCPS